MWACLLWPCKSISLSVHTALLTVDSASICTVFTCIEVSDRPYHASLFGIQEPDQEDTQGLKTSSSGLSWPSNSSLDSLRREKLYQYRPTDPESLASDRALWIQRHNSLSSQSAIYPPSLRCPSTGPLSGPFNLNRSPSIYFPYIPYSPSYRSVSPSSTTTPSPSALGNFYSSLSPSRAASTVSSNTCPTSSTSVRKSPLSTMRRASEPEVPVIPAKFLDANNKPQLRRSPTLPCSWSPSLVHAPLSADPAIRAFSTESENASQRPVMRGESAGALPSINGVRFIEPLLELNLTLQPSFILPELPVRARGHSIPSNCAFANAPVIPTATYSTRPRISTTPSSSAPSSLHIPRSRPLLASNQVNGNSSKRTQLAENHSSAYNNETTSSLSVDVATHDILEAQRVKRRWELARSREASAYGMGGWSTIPREGKEKITSMRKARERGREKKRACTAS